MFYCPNASYWRFTAAKSHAIIRKQVTTTQRFVYRILYQISLDFQRAFIKRFMMVRWLFLLSSQAGVQIKMSYKKTQQKAQKIE